MNSKRDLLNIADVYSDLLDQVSNQVMLQEKANSKKGFAKGSFEVVTGKPSGKKKTTKSAFVQKDSGPMGSSGFNTNIIDTKNKNKNGNFYDPERFSQEQPRKMRNESLNNYMKSTFDKLFENVMGGDDLASTGADDLDTGVDTTETETDSSDSLEEVQDIHTKLAKAIEMLHEIQEELESAEHETEEMGADGEEGEALESSEDEEDEEAMGESQVIWNVHNPVDGSGKKIDTTKSTKLAGAANKYTNIKGKANMVGDSTSKMIDGQVGDFDVNNPVDGSGKVIDTSKSTDLAGDAKKYVNTKGTSNVVKSTKTGKAGYSAFASGGLYKKSGVRSA